MKNISSGKQWERDAPYSQGKHIESSSLIFLSGQVSTADNGDLVGKDDLGAQARQVFNNIKDLLESAGSSMNRVVKLTYYVADMGEWPVVHGVRNEFFPDHKPASTTVEISRLHKAEYLIEIEAIALPG
jgi:2-iminobutanoate/2-iminopropanoate deaminase